MKMMIRSFEIFAILCATVDAQENINNFYISDAEGLRYDRLGSPEHNFYNGTPEYTSAYHMTFFSNPLKNVGDPNQPNNATLQLSQSTVNVVGPFGPRCVPGNKLPSGLEICFSERGLPLCDYSDSECIDTGDDYCRAWGYQGQVDMLSYADFMDLKQQHMDGVSGKWDIRLKIYYSSFKDFRWCNGACQKLDQLNSATEVDTTEIKTDGIYYEITDFVSLHKDGSFHRTTIMNLVCIRDPSVIAETSPSVEILMNYQNTAVGTHLAVPANLPPETFFLAGGKYMNHIAPRTKHILMLPHLRPWKSATLSFYSACGTKIDSPEFPCSLNLDLVNTMDKSHQRLVETATRNDGTIAEQNEWNFNSVPLPIIKDPNVERLVFTSFFGKEQGALGIADLQIRTEEKCFPRWIPVRQRRFRLNPTFDFQTKLDSFERSGLKMSQIKEKFKRATIPDVTLEECSHYCLLGSACDMFEYDPHLQSCLLYPHASLKDKIWTETTAIGNENQTVFILECSTSMSNVLPLNDQWKLKPPVWSETLNNCQGSRIPVGDFRFLNPGTIFSKSMYAYMYECQASGSVTIDMTVKLSNMPMQITQGYLNTVRPSAYLSTYILINPMAPDTSVVHELSLGTLNLPVKEGLMPAGLFIGNVGDHIDTPVPFSLTFSSDTKTILNPVELLVDTPIYVGCFSSVAESSWSPDEVDVTDSVGPVTCIEACLTADPAKRYAIATNSASCFCMEELSQNLVRLPDKACSAPCDHDRNQFCGMQGNTSVHSIYVATCPDGWIRFGDFCYLANAAGEVSLGENEDFCTSNDAHLWYPESFEEAGFVQKVFGAPASVLHVGIRQAKENYGVTYSDYSFGVGLMYFTFDPKTRDLLLEESDDLMSNQKCVISNPTEMSLEVQSPCSKALGVCKTRVAKGTGYKHVGDLKEIHIKASHHEKRTPTADWPVNILLKKNFYQSDRFLEIEWTTQLVVSGLVIKTTKTDFLKKFTLKYAPYSVIGSDHFETIETLPGLNTVFEVFNGNVEDQPDVIEKKILLPFPIETKHIRLQVDHGSPEIISVSANLIGMKSAERYVENPILDPMTIEYVANNADLKKIFLWSSLRDYNLRPGGSILIRAILPRREIINEKVFEFQINDLSNSLVVTLTRDLSSFDMALKIDNTIGNPFNFILPIKFVPGNITYHKAVDFFFKLESSGFRMFINGFEFQMLEKVVFQGQFPSIQSMRWNAVEYGGMVTAVRVVGVYELGLAEKFGLTRFDSQRPSQFDTLFEIQSGELEKLREENALLQYFSRNNDFGFIPFQIRQTCIHVTQGNVRCFPSRGDRDWTRDPIRGFGGGVAANMADKCAADYNHLGQSCIRFPVKGPATFALAVKSCQALGAFGDMIYFPRNQLQNQMFRRAMKAMNEGSIWIGVIGSSNGQWKSSNGEDVSPLQTDWALGEPSSNQGCVIAAKELGFKWKVVSCTSNNKFLCQMYQPKCPIDYEYDPEISNIPGIPSTSCYKVTDGGSHIDEASGKKVHSIATLDDMCRVEGTSLAVIQNENAHTKMNEWLETKMSTERLETTHFMLGLRSTEESNTTVVSSLEFEPQTDLNLEINDNQCLRMRQTKSTITSYPCYEESTELEHTESTRKVMGICQYNDCRTQNLNRCLFPFNYNGRKYDSCITEANNGVGWCNVLSQDDTNRAAGSWNNCTDTCFVNDCPLGFYRNFKDGTCYQFSSNIPVFSASGFSAALEKCRAQGSRLWEPKVLSAITNVIQNEGKAGHFAWTDNGDGGYSATGIKVSKDKYGRPHLTYLSDGTDLPVVLSEKMPWEAGFPNVDLLDESCVVLHKAKFKNVPCEGIYNPEENPTHKYLGYICETRPRLSLNPLESCHFPFVHEGKIYDSCVIDDSDPLQSKRWCASKVDNDGNVLAQTDCLDERRISYDDGAQGQKCKLPFLMNGMYFETCTRYNNTFAEKGPDYWCPSQQFVDKETLEFVGDLVSNSDDSYGLCPNFLFPPDNGCPDHYDAVGNYCFRVSAYPETFEKASSACDSENSFLAYIPNNETQWQLYELISQKRILFDYFRSLNQFWIGAHVRKDSTFEFDWINAPFPMKVFSRFRPYSSSCPKDGCTSAQHGLYMSFRSSGEADWLIEEKHTSLPYVCMTRCKRGFIWYESVERCIRVVETAPEKVRTLPDAMRDCASLDGRLYSPENCTYLDALRQEMLGTKEIKPDQEFFIGSFWVGLNGGKNRRRSSSVSDSAVDAFGTYHSWQLDQGNGLCQKMKAGLTHPDESTQTPLVYTLNLKKDDLETSHYMIADNTQVSSLKKGYICEGDLTWDCPPGYIKTSEECIKLFTEKKSYLDALKRCHQDGAELLSIDMAQDLLLMEEMIHHKLQTMEPESRKLEALSQFRIWVRRSQDQIPDPSSFSGCACANWDVAPSGGFAIGNKCYVKNSAKVSYLNASMSCQSKGLKFAKFETLEEYEAIKTFAGLRGLWLDAYNPDGLPCSDSADCSDQFTWNSTDGNIPSESWFNMVADAESKSCVILDPKKDQLSAVGCDDEKSMFESLCEFSCSGGFDTDALLDCRAYDGSMSVPGGLFVKGVSVNSLCHESNMFICQKEQTVDLLLKEHLPDPVVALPLSKEMTVKEISQGLKVYDNDVGYDSLMTPTGFRGTALFGSNDVKTSRVEMILPDEFEDSQITVSMWFKVSYMTDLMSLTDFLFQPNGIVSKGGMFGLKSGHPYLALSKGLNMIEIDALDRYSIAENDHNWHFIGFSLDIKKQLGVIYFDDKVEHFDPMGNELFDQVTVKKVMVGGSKYNLEFTFRGGISCFQIYNKFFTESEIHSRKSCSEIASNFEEPFCPTGYVYFDNMCYMVSDFEANFVSAEIFCLPDVSDPYRNQLAWTSNRLHLDFLSSLTRSMHGTRNFWIGLDRRQGNGNWINSFGDSVQTMKWANNDTGAFECAKVFEFPGGYLTSEDCETRLPFVCARKPLTEIPDNPCPRDYYSYKDKCLMVNYKRLNFTDAQTSCATSGGYLEAPKDPGYFTFLKSFARSKTMSSLWVGIHKGGLNRVHEPSSGSFPLPTRIHNGLWYSDKTKFDRNTDFSLNMDTLNRECYFLASYTGFEAYGANCSKEYESICRWRDPCPTGFKAYGKVSDGRTCYSLQATNGHGKDICQMDGSDLIRPALPTNLLLTETLMRQIGNTAAWIGFELNKEDKVLEPFGQLDWPLVDPRPFTDQTVVVDLRKNGEDWVTKAIIKNFLNEEDVCVGLGSHGVLHLLRGATCQNDLPSACEYRACLTKGGRECIFPFEYPTVDDFGNSIVRTFNSCSTLDVFRPWCPTAYDPTNNQILEWDFCLDDCPYERPMVVCQLQPVVPKFMMPGGYSINNKDTPYDQSSFNTTKEFDFISFNCPEGYVFNNTNNVTEYSICLNWEYVHFFNPENPCVPVECPCPPWFAEDSAVIGKISQWNGDSHTTQPVCFDPNNVSGRTYGEIVEYTCPPGYVFDTEGFQELENNTDVMNLTCAAWAGWNPPIEPRCIPVNCTDNPYIPSSEEYIASNWDGVTRTYLHQVDYTCSITGYGFPSNGMSTISATCLMNQTWDLTSVEPCQKLPCPSQPPAAPSGGQRWYNMTNTKYTCPQGYMFMDHSLISYINCTASKKWSREQPMECIPRQCSSDPPLYYMKMDMYWPNKSKELGIKVSYKCPFGKETANQRKEQVVECVLDPETDILSWSPPDIEACDREYKKNILSK